MKIKYESGMALMETLIAMLVFALALIPLINLQVRSMEATKAGTYKTEIAAVAESMMDYLRFDRKAIFNNKWDNVIVYSGMQCGGTLNEQEKVACSILNPSYYQAGEFKNRNIQANGNAILCILGEEDKNNDQYLVTIRAVWYSGKRGENDNKFSGKADCNYRNQDNIDYIDINMVY